MDERTAVRLKWSMGALGLAGAVALAVAAWLVLGGFNIAATQDYSQPTSWLIHRTMIDAVTTRAKAIHPPTHFTQAEVVAGFRTYDSHCAMCHGGPGLGREPWVAGLHPTPPFLLDAAEDWRPRELYFIVSQGVKMTGMPAWSQTLSNGQIWDVVAFLEALPRLRAADYRRLRAQNPSPSAPTQPPAARLGVSGQDSRSRTPASEAAELVLSDLPSLQP